MRWFYAWYFMCLLSQIGWQSHSQFEWKARKVQLVSVAWKMENQHFSLGIISAGIPNQQTLRECAPCSSSAALIVSRQPLERTFPLWCCFIFNSTMLFHRRTLFFSHANRIYNDKNHMKSTHTHTRYILIFVRPFVGCIDKKNRTNMGYDKWQLRWL